MDGIPDLRPQDNPELAYILLDEDKLITRIDVYHEALGKLTPGERKAIGFQAKFFEGYEKKYGQRRMWDFYLEQAKAGIKSPCWGRERRSNDHHSAIATENRQHATRLGATRLLLSVKIREALRLPVAKGVNVTLTVQVP